MLSHASTRLWQMCADQEVLGEWFSLYLDTDEQLLALLFGIC